MKELLFQHHWAQRHFAQPEVEILLPGGIADPARIITDVDVFALRPHEDLLFERALGDCRTLRNESPVNRALWLSGLMRFIGARTGLVLLGLPTIESDHRFAANRVGVNLLTQDDFLVYDQAKVFGGSSGAGVSIQDLRDLRVINAKYEGLRGLLDYLYRDSWQEPSFRTLIRHLLGHLRGAAGELDPAKIEHQALLCDTAAILSIGLAECAGRIFQLYLHPAQKEDLANSLRLVIWGGREQYEFYQRMRQQLVEDKLGEQDEQGPLELPQWNSFLQLIRNLLDQPRKAFEVPWLLRQFAVDLFRGRSTELRLARDDAVALKLAMTVVSYVCKAAGVPRDFESRLAGELVRVQAVIISPPSNQRLE